MDDLLTFGAVLTGFLIRFGLPIGLTLLGAFTLKWLDERWKSELDLDKVRVHPLGADTRQVRCWEQVDCPASKRDGCAAYAQPAVPCWQVFRAENNILKEECLSCDVFLSAPPLSNT